MKQVKSQDDAGREIGIVTAMVREAAHLTRRHGRHGCVIPWEADPSVPVEPERDP